MTTNSPDQAEVAAVQADQSADHSNDGAETVGAATTPGAQAAEPTPDGSDTDVTDSAETRQETASVNPGESPSLSPQDNPDVSSKESPDENFQESPDVGSRESLDVSSGESLDVSSMESAEMGPGASPESGASAVDGARASVNKGSSEGSNSRAPSPAAASETELVVDREALEKLQAEAEQLSHKHSAKLNSLRNQLSKLRKAITDEQTELRELADALNTTVAGLLTRNRDHQQQLHDKTVALITTLEKALADGKSEEALPAWDKIQGNISNTSGKIHDALQELANPFKGQINELRDWKAFAATEKKRELIVQMQQLVSADVPPQDLNRQISNLHKQWKALGRSNDNDKLWAEFKTVSDQAYEPCKEFFKQRKQLMADNLKQRRALCEQLEAELARIDPAAVDVGAINKLLASTDKAWKQYAPVEQSKIKPMQKRYYGLLNQLRKLRKSHARENAAQKQALITEAVKLTRLEDNNQAMQEAKRLQRQWKDIGPSSFKEDKAYWVEFRKACDQIFAQRDQVAAARNEKQQQAESELRSLLDKLEQLLALEDAAFRDAKSEFHELARQFNATLNAEGRGARSKLVDRFNELKRRIDGRYRALPDKKTQALKDNLETLLALLEPVEQTLLASGSSSVPAALDDSAWEVLDSVGEQDLVARLNARRSLLSAPESVAEQAQQAENELRTLCIETEIRAGVDSPEADQGTRMQIQLKQLQNGFGQSRPTAKENLLYARQTGLLCRCIGPLDAEAREQLQTRLEQVLRRLT